MYMYGILLNTNGLHNVQTTQEINKMTTYDRDKMLIEAYPVKSLLVMQCLLG